GREETELQRFLLLMARARQIAKGAVLKRRRTMTSNFGRTYEPTASAKQKPPPPADTWKFPYSIISAMPMPAWVTIKRPWNTWARLSRSIERPNTRTEKLTRFTIWVGFTLYRESCKRRWNISASRWPSVEQADIKSCKPVH